jgi:hypothetical protein
MVVGHARFLGSRGPWFARAEIDGRRSRTATAFAGGV